MIAQIATIPDRVHLLEKTVNSLLPQVDKLNIFLNGHEDIPLFLKHEKINYRVLDNSLADGAKLIVRDKGYIFLCDDDLIYPQGYCQYMIGKFNEYDRKHVITLHGRVMQEKPVGSYYRDKTKTAHCLLDLDKDMFVDVGGTGVMLFHTDQLLPDTSELEKYPFIADIHMAKSCYKKGIKIMAVHHKMDWLRYQIPETTIWDTHSENDVKQTELINSF